MRSWNFGHLSRAPHLRCVAGVCARSLRESSHVTHTLLQLYTQVDFRICIQLEILQYIRLLYNQEISIPAEGRQRSVFALDPESTLRVTCLHKKLRLLPSTLPDHRRNLRELLEGADQLELRAQIHNPQRIKCLDSVEHLEEAVAASAAAAGADLVAAPVEVCGSALQLSVREANFFPGRGGFGGSASFGPPDQVFGMRNPSMHSCAVLKNY